MLQTLTYYPLSNTCVLISDSPISPKQVFNNTSASISAVSYDTTAIGSYVGTVGDIVINLISASVVIGTLPYNQTDFFIDAFSREFVTSSTATGMQYDISLIDINPDPSFYFRISSSLGTEVNVGLSYFPNSGFLFTTSSVHILSLYSEYNKNNILKIYDSSSVLIYSSSWIGTGSSDNTFYPTSSNYYYISASISAYCCVPTFLSAQFNSVDSNMLFTYLTGSCDACVAYAVTNGSVLTRYFEYIDCSYITQTLTLTGLTSASVCALSYTPNTELQITNAGMCSGRQIIVEQSSDNTTWSTYISSSTGEPYQTSSIGNYPTTTTYYRLRASCSGSITSDPSNVLIYVP